MLAAEGQASKSHRHCPELPDSGMGRAASKPVAVLRPPEVGVRFSNP